MSRLSDAAYQWLKKSGKSAGVSTDELWTGIQTDFPELGAVTETRKTPRNTMIRDVRLDKKKRFVIENRTVRLSDEAE